MWKGISALAVLAILSLATVALLMSYQKSALLQSDDKVASPGNALVLDRPSSESYSQTRAKIEAERVSLLLSFTKAGTAAQKALVLDQAREALVRSTYADLFPYWYGTPWDFYGTTDTPGKGKIACGYFVTTVLRDLGVKVERARLAQQASENIILSLTTNAHIKRYRRTSIDDFVQAVRGWGTGLYIVGLDVHVGFILNVDNEVYFIHSSYADPFSVVKERAVESKILASSNYRVLGKISADDGSVLKWLRGDQFTTRTSS